MQLAHCRFIRHFDAKRDEEPMNLLIDFKRPIVPLLILSALMCGAISPMAHAVTSTQSPVSITSVESLTSPNAQYFGQFGNSVATDSNIAIVGAGIESVDGLTGAGHAYIFNATTGALLLTLTSPNVQTSGFFGFSVAVSGNLAVVGAIFETVAGQSFAGRAYVFDTTTGSLVRTLTSLNVQSGGRFGFSVAINGNVIVVGAPQETVGGASDAGHAYVFDATSGALLQTLTSPSPQYFGLFGDSVSVSSAAIAVGAPYETDSRAVDAGHAYLFDPATGSLLHTLASPAAQSYAFFGQSVAVDGNTAVVGAPSQPSSISKGAVYVFDIPSGAVTGVLASPSAARGAQFGTSVAINGNVIAAGSPGASIGGLNYEGEAYLYSAQTHALILTLTSPNIQVHGLFGNSVGLSGDTLVVGANGESANGHDYAGHAYVFQFH
jgi:FG-GAP repeat protein